MKAYEKAIITAILLSVGTLVYNDHVQLAVLNATTTQYEQTASAWQSEKGGEIDNIELMLRNHWSLQQAVNSSSSYATIQN